MTFLQVCYLCNGRVVKKTMTMPELTGVPAVDNEATPSLPPLVTRPPLW